MGRSHNSTYSTVCVFGNRFELFIHQHCRCVHPQTHLKPGSLLGFSLLWGLNFTLEKMKTLPRERRPPPPERPLSQTKICPTTWSLMIGHCDLRGLLGVAESVSSSSPHPGDTGEEAVRLTDTLRSVSAPEK